MFVTMDFEIADRILPSICSIAIITWENGKIIDTYQSLVNPDCEVEVFFKDRHGINDWQLSEAPSLSDIWIPVFDRLENKMVFCWNPNQSFRTMMHKAEIEQLNMPNLIYGSVMSIYRRTWGNDGSTNLRDASEMLHMTNIHNNAYEDARTLGRMIYGAARHLELDNVYLLFRKIGFAGGIIKDGIRVPYSAVKQKGNDIYIAKERKGQLPVYAAVSVV